MLDLETYDPLRECEILVAWAEAKEDIKAGRYHTIRRIGKILTRRRGVPTAFRA